MSAVRGAPECTLRLEFCGEVLDVPRDRPFTIGRDADFIVDENPYLHRRFLEIRLQDEIWWLTNTGSQLSATVSDDDARVQAWLAPEARLPVMFPLTVLRFTAGPTTYEVTLILDGAPFMSYPADIGVDGTTTLGRVLFTDEQRLLLVALAEPALRRSGTGAVELPSSAAAAARLGWPLTKFNRKLDNVCQKLKKAGVRGVHGDSDQLASNRRVRVVEYALAVRAVAAADLTLLDDRTCTARVSDG